MSCEDQGVVSRREFLKLAGIAGALPANAPEAWGLIFVCAIARRWSLGGRR
jgi:hypothetical protein